MTIDTVPAFVDELFAEPRQPHNDLLWETYDYIKAHPAEWEQETWLSRWNDGGSCGTRACFAGTTCLLAGLEPYWARSGEVHEESEDIVDNRLGGRPEIRPVEDVAAELLGLDQHQVDLFYASTDLHEVHEMLVKITGENRPE